MSIISLFASLDVSVDHETKRNDQIITMSPFIFFFMESLVCTLFHSNNQMKGFHGY